MVVHESPQYIVLDESPPPPPQPNTVGPVPPPPSPRPRQAAYIQRVQGIPHLIRPSCGGGFSGGGGGIPLVGGRRHLLLHAPHPCLALRGGPLVPLWQGGLLGGAVVGHLLLLEGGVPSFRRSAGPAQTRGEDELQHTCGCPRCETCIQSLMAQVKDLRTQNLELQRSHQELSQAVASTAGISQSYGDRMTQILSTLAKFDAAF